MTETKFRPYEKDYFEGEGEGTVFTLDEYRLQCDKGSFIDDDGTGYLMKGTELVSDVEFEPSAACCRAALPDWATHVCWYNK